LLTQHLLQSSQITAVGHISRHSSIDSQHDTQQQQHSGSIGQGSPAQQGRSLPRLLAPSAPGETRDALVIDPVEQPVASTCRNAARASKNVFMKKLLVGRPLLWVAGTQ
jgi:hypothetical protein